jgi:xylulokinase
MTASPLFDFREWDATEVRRVGAEPRQLPDIVSGSDPAGRALDELGPMAGAVVGGGTIDAFAEQLVAGADHSGDVLVILGATLIIWAAVPEWVEVPGLWTVPHTAPGLTLVGGASNAGGLFRDMAQRTLLPPSGEPSDVENVPVWLPYVRGERTPLHDPHRRAELHQTSIAHGPDELWRAVHEASGFVVRRHLDLAGLLPGSGPTTAERIVATGGGTRSGAWLRAIADATDLPVDRVAVPEGAALGAAYLARCAAGLEPDATGAPGWARRAERILPRPEWAAACRVRYERFVELSGPPFDPRAA